MKCRIAVNPAEVQAIYRGPEGRAWMLLMGEHIHVGGSSCSEDLAAKAGVLPGTRGVDLGCGAGGPMRFLVRTRGVAHMTGVDTSQALYRRLNIAGEDTALARRLELVVADAGVTGLHDACADFVWGQDAWCYVADREQLIAEAMRLLKPGGTIAFTDWITGPTAMSEDETDRLCAFMKFPGMESIASYSRLLSRAGCRLALAEDTGRFPSHFDLYMGMIRMQHSADLLRIFDFDELEAHRFAAGVAMLQNFGHAGKIVQGLFVAQRR